jgi:hypothetical protein
MENLYSKIGKVSVVVGGDLNTSPDETKNQPGFLDQTFRLTSGKQVANTLFS